MKKSVREPDGAPDRPFSDVDATPDPAEFVRFLDRVADRLRERKREGFDLLELKPGDAVLDAGCGPATDLFELEALVGPAGRVVGIDASKAMIDEGRARVTERGSSAELHIGTVEALPFPDGTFDAVRVERVLMHVDEPLLAIRELARVTKPGGRVVAIEPDHQMLTVDSRDGTLADAIFRGMTARLASPRIGRQLRAMFLEVGLTDLETIVSPSVVTSLSLFRDILLVGLGSIGDVVVAQGIATEAQVTELFTDLETRDSQGAFFACLVGMCCRGVKHA